MAITHSRPQATVNSIGLCVVTR